MEPGHEDREDTQLADPYRVFGGGNPVMSVPSSSGVAFDVRLQVDMAEMATWSPDRITAFFGGIAAVLAAKNASENATPTGGALKRPGFDAAPV